MADFALDIFYDLEEECSQEKVLYLERLSRLKGYQNKIEIVEFNKPSKEGKMPPKYLDGTFRVRGTSIE